MNAHDFSYWLQGFVEMNPNAMVTGTQWQIVKDHLALVHNKVTPQRIDPAPRHPFNWHLQQPQTPAPLYDPQFAITC